MMTDDLTGATNISGTNIIFPNGSIDPWHALGLTSTKTAARPAAYINGTAHWFAHYLLYIHHVT